MAKVLWLMVCVLALSANATAQSTNSGSALQSVVETEWAFSKASEDKGTREAFLAFIAEDGVLFRPTAVKGKQWMLEHSVPPSSKRALLSWRPIFADISQAGDVGYTTGPWEFKQDIQDAKPVAFGNFVTVWKKQADGTWKFAIDLGISNPEPKEPIAQWRAPENSTLAVAKKLPNVDINATRAELSKRDREFSNASAKQGASKAFLAYATNDVRLFREGNFPFVGRDAAAQALATSKSVWTWQPDSAEASLSGDLGYSYGTYELRSTDAVPVLTEKGNYLRIWRKQSGLWKVVLDVANPLPPEQKKN